jgi:hypothetical protein
MGRNTTAAPPPRHEDPGLQPERTTLAWGRTMIALVTASAIFLRWVQHHGPFVLTLFAVAIVAAAAIYLTQRLRYHRGVRGMVAESVPADAAAVLWTSLAALALGGLGIFVVLTL